MNQAQKVAFILREVPLQTNHLQLVDMLENGRMGVTEMYRYLQRRAIEADAYEDLIY